MNNPALAFLQFLTTANFLHPLTRRQIRLLYQSVYPPQTPTTYIENPPETWEESGYNDAQLLLLLTLLFVQLQKGSTVLPFDLTAVIERHITLAEQVSAQTFAQRDAVMALAQQLKHCHPPAWLVQPFNDNTPTPEPVANPVQPLIVRRNMGWSFQRYSAAENIVKDQFFQRLKSSPYAKTDITSALQTTVAASAFLPHQRQLAAVILACQNLTTIISGGPGTGKTTVCAQIIRTLSTLDPNLEPAEIALAAPTGRAAARLKESVQAQLQDLPKFSELRSCTLHILLKFQSHNNRFTYHEHNKLPCKLVIIDESSMVDLSMFAKFLAALAPECQLVLLGDKDQLPSVNAGAVLGDLSGAFYKDSELATLSADRDQEVNAILQQVGHNRIAAKTMLYQGRANRLVDNIMILTYSFRNTSTIRKLAQAVQAANSAEFDYILQSGYEVTRAPDDLATTLHQWMQANYSDEYVRQCQQEFKQFQLNEKFSGDHPAARAVINHLHASRILCPIKGSPQGVHAINQHLQNKWLRNYSFVPGTPLIIQRNSYKLNLYNGDTGVVVLCANGLGLLCEMGAEFQIISLANLPAHELCHAMTVHKSQGSEYNNVLLVLPSQDNILLSREIIYTGITRAKKSLQIHGWQPDLGTRWLHRTISRDSGIWQVD